jgi:hypothetical protein
MTEDATIDREVRRVIYERTLGTGRPPLAREIAPALGMSLDDVTESLCRLADAHILVLQQDVPEILMAAPWSAVPTPFVVDADGTRSFANCIWDALGIAAMHHADATITTSCGDCGTALVIRIENGTASGEGLVHFALPARQWWDDIVFT